MAVRRSSSFLSISNSFSRSSLSITSPPLSNDAVPIDPIPDFDTLNPYAHYGKMQSSEDGNVRWQPVPGIIHSKESLALRQEIGNILTSVHSHTSPDTLEIRASTPEYRLETDDWIRHPNTNEKGTMKAVARLPMDLLQIDDTSAASEAPPLSISGWLKKRGENNKAMKKRYMELEDRILHYYKKKPERNGCQMSTTEKASLMKGKIELDDVSSIQPTVIKGNPVKWGIDLVTTNRTWTLQAESESDYDMWVKYLCHSVPFHSVNVIYRRMLQLAEVSASGPNEVRMVLLPTYTVQDTVAHVFECYHNMLDSIPLHPYDPKEYVLKFTGYRDYMIDPTQELGIYQHVRECILTRKTLCLTLVHESDIEEALKLSAHAPSYKEFVDSLSSHSSELATTTLDTDSNSPEVESKNEYGQSGVLMSPLSFNIQRILNIPKYTCIQKRTAHDVTIERRPLVSTTVFVRIELYDGGQLIELVGDTCEVPLRPQPGSDCYAAVWNEPTWYQSKLSISTTPRSTRIVLTLFAPRQDGYILTAGRNVFDIHGDLEQGDQYIQMWNNLHHAHQGPVPHIVLPDEPLIHLTLHSFGKRIVFDWSQQDQDLTERDEVVKKEGWLKKTGKFHTLTNWQPRWCVLNHINGTLYYSDTPTAPYKGTIQLHDAQVVAADELNEKYTTFAVNKGTRKEQSTWVFKIKLNNNKREYIFSAITRQEREEWMIAIKIISNKNKNEILNELYEIIERDPLYQLNEYQKTLLWYNRNKFINNFQALKHILLSVNWKSKYEINIILNLLLKWKMPQNPASYLILLNIEYSNSNIRKFAVNKLNQLNDSIFSTFLPQFIQALKYESYHVSDLSKLLIKRAILNPNQIGFYFFWAMKVESYNIQYRERYGLLLNEYINICSFKMRRIFELQDLLFSEKGEFEKICQEIKILNQNNKTKDEMILFLHQRLTILNKTLPFSYQLPIDPRIAVGKIVIQKCKIMTSAKLPLWLEFENAEDGGEPIVIIFKAGDDVRQDCLTLQLIHLMDEMWRQDGKDLAMEPYKCVSTGPMTGMLQVVLHAVTTAAVHKRGGALGGIFGAFNDVSFSDWITANNSDPRSRKAAVDLFLRSCAGYCVATYVLGIGDRHNDNIMITKQGRYFHIDFGHFLGFMKYQYGIKREKTPFVFTPEMAHVFGGVGTNDFNRFKLTCGQAFLVVRRHLHLLISLLILMIPAEMPELRNRDDMSYLVEVAAMERHDDDAMNGFGLLIIECMNNTFKRIDNTLHIIKHR